MKGRPKGKLSTDKNPGSQLKKFYGTEFPTPRPRK